MRYHGSLIGLGIGLSIMASTALAAEEASDASLSNGLIFYAPMDGSADAVKAQGNPSPLKAVETSFAEGKFGQGLQLKGSAQIYYSGEGNFQLKQGTVAMWIKREKPWNVGSYIFCKGAGSEWNRNAFYLHTTSHKQLRAWIWDEQQKQTTVMTPGNFNYPANEWHHLTATYTDGSVKFYIDGQELGYAVKADPMLEMPSGCPKFLRFGSDYTPQAVLDGVMDEVRVYDRVLSPEEVAKLAALVPSGK